jgi:hypothetical protein
VRTIARTAPEQISQAHATTQAGVKTHLKLGKSIFGWTNGPAVVAVEPFDGRMPLGIQRADVPHLDRVPRLVLVEPAQWQALRPADVRTLGVNATGSALVEERARAGRVRFGGCEQGGMMADDDCSLDLEDREVVDAAIATAEAAAQPAVVDSDEARRQAVDDRVEALDPVHQGFGQRELRHEASVGHSITGTPGASHAGVAPGT